MEYNTLKFEVRDRVAFITLNRPEAANGFDLAMSRDLMNAAFRCNEDPGIRAVLLTGAGSMFCCGGDLQSFASAGENLPLLLKEMTTCFNAAVSTFARMDPPIIVAVNGTAMAAGVSLVAACDLSIAQESSNFIMGYNQAGLSPDASSTYFLPRVIGLKRAMEFTLTPKVLTAKEALDWGLLNQVVPDAELLDKASALATQLASAPTKALGATKRLLHTAWVESLETQMVNEAQTIANISRTADAAEGIAALMQQRQPQFQGQ